LAILYVNCRTYNTTFKILAYLLDTTARGASQTELYERFCRQFPGRTVVVLDEVDLMSPKDRRREILYLLSRSNRPYMVVMLSNNPHVLKELDPATRSSLQPELIHFRNYDAAQILEILQQRARRGLRTWDEGQLSQIAALTARKTNADARVAIKTLYYMVTGPAGDVGDCFEKARRDIVVDMINDLSDANLMILKACATSRTDFAKDIYERYCQYCQSQREKPFSYVYFYSNLSYLQSVGLIALVSAKVAKTYTNRVLLTFDREILEPVCKLRFEWQ
jgi:cell division control protein 6